MLLEELERRLPGLIGDNFRIVIDNDGQVIIFSGLRENDDDGELETLSGEEYSDEDLDLVPLMMLKDVD